MPTLPKNSPAIRLETELSIRWPTPPTMPPTTASASYAICVWPGAGSEKATLTVASTVPGAPAPESRMTSDWCSCRSESAHEPV